jgi:galactokinase
VTRACAFAPGRVNLIGEHTDYAGGLALPFAVREGVTVTATVPGSPPRDPLIRGVFAELRREGVPAPDAAIEVASELPPGAGLSSSAAVTVALALALCALAGERHPPLRLARVCQRVEQGWAGARTGLLDQLASLLGGPVLIDFSPASPTWHAVPLDLRGHRLVLLDSGERRELSSSGYTARRAELAEATSLAARQEHLPPQLASRLRHVTSENDRTRVAEKMLLTGDMTGLGQLLNASHTSLRDDYEVSTPAVERTRDRLLDAGALGARIHGGGFGGSVLGLLPPDAPVPDGARPVSPGTGARILPAEDL